MKIKFDAKDFLLRRGELLAMGAAGFCLAVLLIWGASKWSSAKDPNDIAKELASQSDQVKQRIAEGKASDEDLKQVELPAFLVKPPINKAAKTSDFPISGPVFDPVGTPNTKRENPIVLSIDRDGYQVDLIRSAMPGYDIIYDNNDEPLIAVLATQAKGKLDADRLRAAASAVQQAGQRGRANIGKLKNPPKNVGGMDEGGMPPGPGGIGGIAGGQFNANDRRDDKVIQYVPLKSFDDAVKAGKVPALTVIPVRLVTIHAVVPYKKQLEEIKRALRLATDVEAKSWGPWYDGFEIQRRETRARSDGKAPDVIQDWTDQPKDTPNYKFEEKYIDVIDTRKVGDNFDEGFLPYFLKPDMLLSMPLPLLAPDLKVKYPEIRLKAILDNIKKLEDANKPKVAASDLVGRLNGTGRSRADMYNPRPDASAGFGENNFGGQRVPNAGGAVVPPVPKINPVAPGGPGGTPRRPDDYDPYAGAGAPPTEVENFLLRFVDCDVKPGRTYEYRVRLRMSNPNYMQDKLVANPEFAKEAYRTLYSKWLQLDTSITVPAESFLYAFDTKSYRERTAAAYEGQKELLNRLQIKDNQAVVQMATWMEQVRAGTKREPVGAWVVTEIPVGRAEYIGRQQYVKLPLWSSETQQYLLREVADKIVGGTKAAKDQPQPKGWLVDFSTKSILVDFEGGKVKSKFSVGFDEKGNLGQRTRQFEEEVATELLIVRPDGKLVVRSSRLDETDENRKDVESKWSEWLKLVEGRKGPGGDPGTPGQFDPKRP